MTSTKRFDEIGKDGLALAGGKGALETTKREVALCRCAAPMV